MVETRKMRLVLLGALSIVLLAACNRGGPDAADTAQAGSILRYVPANTPYLFATGEPLPDKVLDKLSPKVDDMLKAYQRLFREQLRSMLTQNSDEMSDEEKQRFSDIVNELSSLMSTDGLKNAGFDRDSQMVLYGNGLLPVVRIEVSDAKLFDAAIGRIEAAAGDSMSIAELDGKTYRYIGDDKASLVIGAFDGSAVFTMLPSGFDDDQKRQLLGLTLPAASIAATSTLKDLEKEYGFSGHYIGFIDGRRLTSTFIDSPTGLDVPLLASLPEKSADISADCKAEIRAFVDIAPRIVFGYDEISADAMSGSMIVEMRPDIATGLAKVAASVPGLGKDPGGLFSMGFGFNLLSLREFYEARLDAMDAQPYKCEYFQDLQAGVSKGRELLNQPIPPVAYGLRGFMAVVNDIGDYDMSSGLPPTDIDASIVVGLDDAQTMVAMGAMFSPELAGLNLQPDGKPVLLDLPQMQIIGQAVYAAMLDDAIALSVGNGAEKRVASALTSDGAQPPPLFSMTMDAGRYYALIADGMMMEDDEANQAMSPAAREALRDAMLAVGDMYDRMAVDLHFTARGMELDSRVTLKD